jgi:dipeptidyl aminopeptidase/acylaminoacyl peptidase
MTDQKQSHHSKRTIAAFGSWVSPISSATLTATTIGLSEIQADGDSIYWIENRPEEKGRNAIVQYRDGRRRDILPRPLNARSKVNEYGGGSYCVRAGIIYFVLYDDQRIYRVDANSTERIPEPVTAASQCRFADLQSDSSRQRLIAVMEDHADTDVEPTTSLVAIDVNVVDGQQKPQPLVTGADFYASPRISPNGKQLTWLSWNHPNMPWDNCECWLADITVDGTLINPRLIAGGNNESIVQPRFSPAGDLVFVSDRNNWWNLYCWRNSEINCLCEKAAEFAGPQWVFGQSHYDFINTRTIVGSYSSEGRWHLYQLDTETRALVDMPTPCSDIAYVQAYRDGATFVGAGAKSYDTIYQLNQQKTLSIIAEPVKPSFSPAFISQPQAIEFPLSSRAGKGQAFYYSPANDNYCGPDNEAPPVLVFCHGGPTSATRSSLNLKIQYWTSRGIAVADVNYGGSTGFGRRYRDALIGQWGMVDVQDCIDCVNFLVEHELADKNKLAIRGGSAGGYTVLCALTFHKVFKAGASHYGVGDLETLATDTHKFESRYLDSLIGPYPQQKQLYRQRSPIHHLDSLSCPVIFFQGLQDKVVPPNQAQAMVDALDKKGIAHAHVTFAEEGHGFRQAPNQRRALEAELYFYSRVFNFPLAEKLEPVAIRHLGEK